MAWRLILLLVTVSKVPELMITEVNIPHSGNIWTPFYEPRWGLKIMVDGVGSNAVIRIYLYDLVISIGSQSNQL